MSAARASTTALTRVTRRINAPSMAQLMDLNMLVMLTGRERNKAEFEALLLEAGLRLERVHATHSPFFVLEVVAASS